MNWVIVYVTGTSCLCVSDLQNCGERKLMLGLMLHTLLSVFFKNCSKTFRRSQQPGDTSTDSDLDDDGLLLES